MWLLRGLSVVDFAHDRPFGYVETRMDKGTGVGVCKMSLRIFVDLENVAFLGPRSFYVSSLLLILLLRYCR